MAYLGVHYTFLDERAARTKAPPYALPRLGELWASLLSSTRGRMKMRGALDALDATASTSTSTSTKPAAQDSSCPARVQLVHLPGLATAFVGGAVCALAAVSAHKGLR